MVYGAMNEKDESWYTQMGKVFEAINNKQKEYNYEKEKANVAMVEYKKETLIEKILKFFKSRFKKY